MAAGMEKSGGFALGGLTPAEVEASRRAHGANDITRRQRNGFFKQFIAGFNDPIIKILLVALGINGLLLLRGSSWLEPVGILVAVLLSTFVSTLSEYGSEAAFAKMQREASKTQCRVRRAGEVMTITVTEIVVGDLVLLQPGDKIPADGEMVEGKLSVDQSALNGESIEVTKQPGKTGAWSLSDAALVFQGSVAVAGEGVMRVLRVGDATMYGAMAAEMQEETRESPLKVRLGHLAGTLSKIGYVAAGLVAFADLFHSLVLSNHFDRALMLAAVTDWANLAEALIHALVLAITVVVVAVPEGLPMMITVVLSSNMLRMLRDKVLVRKMVGIETSGSMNILFTDKTGTLTSGNLEMCRVLCGDGRVAASQAERDRLGAVLDYLALSGHYNSAAAVTKAGVTGGNATDRALLRPFAPMPRQAMGFETVQKLPFDSARKYSAVHIRRGGESVILIKGAPEKLLPHCRQCYHPSGRVHPISSAAVHREWKAMTDGALRVVAVATAQREITEGGTLPELTLVALVGIRDELRPSTKKAVQQICGAGIQLVMITGDNRDTAVAVAQAAGILREGEKGAVVTGEELAHMSDDALRERLPSLRVVARAVPTDKSRLVRLAQELGMVAGMTGDGVNDAPALKKADVGFAMGSGTEVAKEAGDIVILDDNIASIGKAILYGRTIFKSIRKFIIFQLTMNFCAVGVSVLGPFLGVDMPVTVIQMLWVNIIMDTLAGLAFAGEAPLAEYMRERPKRREEPVLNRYMLSQIIGMGLFTVGLCVFFLKAPFVKTLFRAHPSDLYFLTGFFTLFILCGVFNCFSARTHRLNLLSHLAGNRLFLVIIAAVIAVQLLLIYCGGTMFRTAGLLPGELRVVFLMAFLVIPADLVRKVALRLAHRKGSI